MENLCDQMLSDRLLKSTARKQSRLISGVTEILPSATCDPPRNWLRTKFENFSFSSSGNPHLSLRSENASGGDQVSVPDHPANSGKKLTRFHELNGQKNYPTSEALWIALSRMETAMCCDAMHTCSVLTEPLGLFQPLLEVANIFLPYGEHYGATYGWYIVNGLLEALNQSLNT